VSVSETFAALTRLGFNEDVSEEEVLGALASGGHISNTPSLREIGAHSKIFLCAVKTGFSINNYSHLNT
jgi:hypothetical protein